MTLQDPAQQASAHARIFQDPLRPATEDARDVIGLFDVEGNRLYVNKPGLEFFAPAEPGEGRDGFAHIHPEDRERARNTFASTVRTGVPARFEVRALRRDGSVRVMQSEATPVRDASGQVMAILGIARDVTEERRGEAALKGTLETLFEQVPIGVCVTDLEGRFLRANHRIQEIYGYSHADLLTRTIWDLTHPDDKPRVEKLRGDLIAGRIDQFSVEKRTIHPAGRVHWVACNIAIVRPPFGAASFILEIVEDISERKRLDAALIEREELLEAIFQHASVGIALTDLEARYLRVNPRFARMLGYAEEELYRLTGWDVTHADDVETNRKLRDELFDRRRAEFTWQKRYVRKDGEVLWAQNTVSIIRDAAGEPRYAMALVEDITERRLADAAIRATAAQLHALTRRLVDVQETERRDIARELHDRVGQTLTAMRVNMDMIRTRLDESDDAVIRRRNDDSLRLIASAFKAVENVMQELRPPLLDDYGLVAQLQWYARQFAERTGIRVEVRGREDRRFESRIELALFRVAQEALNNVARHAHARHVAVVLEENAACIVLTIADDGVGFDHERDGPEKAGYGLITMRERIEAVGGAFEARSVKGQGTTIRVQVPLP